MPRPNVGFFESVLGAAFAAEGPVVIEAVVEPTSDDVAEDALRLREEFPQGIAGDTRREQIEANVAEEPLASMLAAGKESDRT